MKLSSIVRAISPFTRTNNSNSEPPKQSNINRNTLITWDLSDVDLKHALKLFYKKYNPEKSFIVADILQKYSGEEQLLLRQLQERYKLSNEDIQMYLDKATMNFDNKVSTGNLRRQSKFIEDSARNHSEDKDYIWDLHDVDVVALLQYIYSKYNPSRTPNLEILRQKSDKDILIILRQLCKRHQLSYNEMSHNVEKFRGPQTSGSYDQEDATPVEPRIIADPVAPVASIPPPPPPARRISTSRNSRPSNHEEKANFEERSQEETASNARSKAAMSSRLRPVLSEGKLALMDEVLRQMNGRQSDSGDNEDGTVVNSVSNHVLDNRKEQEQFLHTQNIDLTKEVEDMKELCDRQQMQIDELHRSLRTLQTENVQLIDELDTNQRRQFVSIGIQATDQTVLFELENSKKQSKELRDMNDLLLSDLNSLKVEKNKLSDNFFRAQQAIDNFQIKHKALQSDRESLLQFVNALCQNLPSAKATVDAYFIALLDDYGDFFRDHYFDDNLPVSDRLDDFLRLLNDRNAQDTSESSYLSVDHRAVMKNAAARSAHVMATKNSSSVNNDTRNDDLQADERDEEYIMRQQYDLTKKLIETKKSQAKLEGKLAQTNFELLQAAFYNNTSSEGNVNATSTPPVDNFSRSVSPFSSLERGRQQTRAKALDTGVDNNVNDWIECIDPKSKRKYYFSAALKKSTWTRPPSFLDPQEEIEASIPQATRKPFNIRDPSPTPSLNSFRSSASVSSTNSHSSSRSLFSQRSKVPRSTSPNASASTVASDWIAAIDPKSNRKYWFNRKTKVSTWRKPAELII